MGHDPPTTTCKCVGLLHVAQICLIATTTRAPERDYGPIPCRRLRGTQERAAVRRSLEGYYWLQRQCVLSGALIDQNTVLITCSCARFFLHLTCFWEERGRLPALVPVLPSLCSTISRKLRITVLAHQWSLWGSSNWQELHILRLLIGHLLFVLVVLAMRQLWENCNCIASDTDICRE